MVQTLGRSASQARQPLPVEGPPSLLGVKALQPANRIGSSAREKGGNQLIRIALL